MNIDLKNLDWSKIFSEIGNIIGLTILFAVIVFFVLLVIAAFCAMSSGAQAFFGFLFGCGIILALIARFIFGLNFND